MCMCLFYIPLVTLIGTKLVTKEDVENKTKICDCIKIRNYWKGYREDLQEFTELKGKDYYERLRYLNLYGWNTEKIDRI